MKRILLIICILVLPMVANAQTNGLQVTPLMLANLEGIQGIITNMVEEGGVATTLTQPSSHFKACVSEAYPTVKVTYHTIKETIMLVHSDTTDQNNQIEDEVGIGFNTEKHQTPKGLNPTVGSVAPVAHHGIFVNVVVGTSKAIKGRFDGRDTSIQAGGYVTF